MTKYYTVIGFWANGQVRALGGSYDGLPAAKGIRTKQLKWHTTVQEIKILETLVSSQGIPSTQWVRL